MLSLYINKKFSGRKNELNKLRSFISTLFKYFLTVAKDGLRQDVN